MFRKHLRMVPQGHSAINRARAELTMVLADKSWRQDFVAAVRPAGGVKIFNHRHLACRSM
jgi:hypothetical protein